jgi:thioredoxin-like negative regulator of GroEL
MPALKKAAVVLRKENLIVAKVDTSVSINLASKYRVTYYPTVIFFKNGKLNIITQEEKNLM